MKENLFLLIGLTIVINNLKLKVVQYLNIVIISVLNIVIKHYHVTTSYQMNKCKKLTYLKKIIENHVVLVM